MTSRSSSEKRRPSSGTRFKPGCRALIVLQHIILWSASFVLSATIYLLAEEALDSNLLPSSILLIAAATISLIYLSLHNAAAYHYSKQNSICLEYLRANLQWTAVTVLSLTVIVWIIACALSIMFTLAKPLYCLAGSRALTSVVVGPSCVVQRSSIIAAVLALSATFTSFVLLQKAPNPFRSHLFGIVKESPLLPLALPFKTVSENAMYSEMSFKCRSSTSISSHRLVASQTDSVTHLLPSRPEHANGLGIYAPRQSAPSFLTPRPSLSSIRTHTTMNSMRPPSSPLPPLPAYCPDKYRRCSAMAKAVYPPKPGYQQNRRQSEKTVRIVPPSPALSTANLAAFNRSTESLSSVYSRSISGDGRDPRASLVGAGSRSYSSESTSTIAKSPLGAMRLASDPETVVMSGAISSESGDGADSDIDDATTLQAKLPSIKAVSEFGQVEDWHNAGRAPVSYCERASEVNDEGVMKRLNFTPLMVRKTRDA